MYEDLTIRDFLDWLATKNIRLVRTDEEYEVDETLDRSQVLAQWKAEEDS